MANDFHPDMRRVLALGVLFCLGTLVGRADQGRFSRSITPSDRTAVGILHLSSDQIAVLDALIRRDEQVHAFPQQGQRQPARFTERLSPEETRNAGLDLLTSAERARLDTLVERYESLGQAEQAAAGTAPGIGLETDPLRPTVHGMISLTYGVGSGGYHELGGAMAVSIDDPAHGMSLFVSYAQSQAEGRGLGRRCAWGPWSDYLADPYGPGWP